MCGTTRERVNPTSSHKHKLPEYYSVTMKLINKWTKKQSLVAGCDGIVLRNVHLVSEREHEIRTLDLLHVRDHNAVCLRPDVFRLQRNGGFSLFDDLRPRCSRRWEQQAGQAFRDVWGVCFEEGFEQVDTTDFTHGGGGPKFQRGQRSKA